MNREYRYITDRYIRVPLYMDVLPLSYGESCVVSGHIQHSTLSKCVVAVGSIEGVVGSNHQVPLSARGLLVKSNME